MTHCLEGCMCSPLIRFNIDISIIFQVDEDPAAQLPWLHEWFLSFISHGNCKSEIGFGCFLIVINMTRVLSWLVVWCNSKGRWDECPSESFEVSMWRDVTCLTKNRCFVPAPPEKCDMEHHAISWPRSGKKNISNLPSTKPSLDFPALCPRAVGIENVLQLMHQQLQPRNSPIWEPINSLEWCNLKAIPKGFPRYPREN